MYHSQHFSCIILGVGVIVSMKLKCYPLGVAAVLSFDQMGPKIVDRYLFIKNWSKWLYGGNISTHESVDTSKLFTGTPSDVFSYILLPTNSAQMKFFGCSIDTTSIPQNADLLEQFQEFSLKKGKFRSLFNHSKKPPFSVESVPGLSDLMSNSLGDPTEQSNFEFNLLQYQDELQTKSNQFLEAGNNYISYKYANSLSDTIIKILCEATTGESSCHNESRIFIFSM